MSGASSDRPVGWVWGEMLSLALNYTVKASPWEQQPSPAPGTPRRLSLRPRSPPPGPPWPLGRHRHWCGCDRLDRANHVRGEPAEQGMRTGNHSMLDFYKRLFK